MPRSDCAAALLAFGPRAAITAVTAMASASTAAPPPASAAVTLESSALVAAAVAATAALLAFGPRAAIVAVAALTAASAMPVPAVVAFPAGAGGRSGSGFGFLAAEQAFQPAEETAGLFLGLGS